MQRAAEGYKDAAIGNRLDGICRGPQRATEMLH